jgi:hypothetical protein
MGRRGKKKRNKAKNGNSAQVVVAEKIAIERASGRGMSGIRSVRWLRWDGSWDYVAAVLVPVLFLFHLFTTDEVFFGSGTDMVSVEYPFHRFATSWMAKGVLPLWNPYIFGGVPFQTGVHGYLYPGWWSGVVLPTGFDIKLGILLHLILAVTGGVFFARFHVKSRTSSFVAGVIFGLSAFNVSHCFAGHRVMIATAAYLPWIAGALDRAVAGSKSYFPLGGAFCGLMLLCGHYHVVFISMGGLLLYHLVDGLLGDKRESSRVFGVAKRGICWAIVFGVGLFLSAVQLFPMLATVELSQRAGGSVLFSSSFSSAPANLLSYIYPNAFGNMVEVPFIGSWSYWESLGYLGVVPLPLLLICFILLPWRSYSAALVVIICGLVLALGVNTPLFELYFRFAPGADLFRSPGRFCLLVALFGSLITARTLDTWQTEGISVRRKILAGGVLCFGSLFAIWEATVFSSLKWQDYKNWVTPFSSARRLSIMDGDAWDSLLQIAQTDATKAAIVFCVISIVVLLGLKKPSFVRVLGMLIALVLVCDLYDFGHRFFTTAPARRFELPKPIAEVIRREGGLGARYIPPPSTRWHDYGAIHGFGNPGGYDSFIDGRYARYMNRSQKRELARFFGYEKLRRGSPLIRHLGPEFLLSHGPLKNGRNRHMIGYNWFEPFMRMGGVHIYRDPQVPPRAAVVHRITKMEDELAIYQKMETPDFDIRDQVIVEGDLPADFDEPEPKLVGAVEGAKIVRYDPNGVEIETVAASRGVLVLSDTLHPGWSAQVDGKPVPMVHANRVMRAVPVPSGKHVVTMEYLPGAFVLGAFVSCLSILALVAVLGIWRRGKKGSWR